jgi:hypothetical protein
LNIVKIIYKKVKKVVQVCVRSSSGKCFKTSFDQLENLTENKKNGIIKKITSILPKGFEKISYIHIDYENPREVIVDISPVAIVLKMPSVCIVCDAEIQLEDKTWVEMQKLIVGQRILVDDDKIATIDTITKSAYKGSIYGSVTGFHPIEHDGQLKFACDVLKPSNYEFNNDVYNIGGVCDDGFRAKRIRIKDFKYPVACAFSNEVSEGKNTYSKEWGTTSGSLYNLVKKRGGFVNLEKFEFQRDEKTGIATKIVSK